MEQNNDSPSLTETSVPVSKAVISMLRKANRIAYAKDENGSLYVSDGHYIQKVNETDFEKLTGQVNKGRNASDYIPIQERQDLLAYVDKAKGNYELSRKPYDLDSHYFFADDNRYYGYNKNYVNVFDNYENRLFIDDNTSGNVINNCLIVKGRDDEVLGVVLPIKISEETLKLLKEEMPLSKRKQSERSDSSIFLYLKQSPWGEIQKCEKLCPGVFTVSAENGGGVMVAYDMTAALSTAALQYGVTHNGYMCFEENRAKDVVLRELLDKKLLSAPENIKDKAAYEEKINKSLREHFPEYWRSRERGRSHAPPAKEAKTHDER